MTDSLVLGLSSYIEMTSYILARWTRELNAG